MTASGNNARGGGPLCSGLHDLIDRLGTAPDGSVARGVDRVIATLDEPLRVAILGRLNTGKSTIVNALLRQRVAQTDDGECTRIVTWYRYGYPERAEVLLLDGTTFVLPIDDGGLPERLGVDPASVRSATVWLSNELLKTFTLIDTPGLGSINAEIARATREFLLEASASMGPIALADAILYVVRDTVTSDELEALQALRARIGTAHGLAVGTLGVLTRIDQFCDPARLFKDADMVAGLRERDLSGYVNSVTPVLGLLAESAEAGLLAEHDLDDIAKLAAAPRDRGEQAFLSPEDFKYAAPALGVRDPERLLGLLDMFGLAQVLMLYSSGSRTAADLHERLAERSGLARLRTRLTDELARNADALRASWALRSLWELSFSELPGAAEYLLALRSGVEELRDSAAMHRLIELEARQAVLAGDVMVPEPWRAEFLRLTGNDRLAVRIGTANGEDPAGTALGGVARWRRFATMAVSPAQERLAHVAIRSYTLARKANTPHSGQTT